MKKSESERIINEAAEVLIGSPPPIIVVARKLLDNWDQWILGALPVVDGSVAGSIMELREIVDKYPKVNIIDVRKKK